MPKILTASEVAEIEARAACQPPFDMDKDEAKVSIAALCGSLRHAMELLRPFSRQYFKPEDKIETQAALAAWDGGRRDDARKEAGE